MGFLTLTEHEAALVLAGQYLDAIRAVRARTGVSFSQARRVVVTFEAERLATRYA